METLTRTLRTIVRRCAMRGGLAALCIVLMPVMAGAAESVEYAVKAAYLYKFGLYVEWPNNAFASPASPVNLCVAGDDPFGPTLDEAVRGQSIGGRTIAIRRLKTVTRDSACHILYVGSTDAARSGQIIEAVRGSGVLTVSDGRPPGGAAPVINFVIKDNRVRFDINEEAAAQNGLAISSKLLSLALNVKTK